MVTKADQTTFSQILVSEGLDQSIYGSPFPRLSSDIFGIWEFMEPCGIDLEAAIQYRRLLQHKEAVHQAIQQLTELNRHLLQTEYDLAIQSVEELIGEHGYSAAAIRKILFLFSQVEINDAPLKSKSSRGTIQRLMDEIYKNKRRRLLNLYTSYLVDLFDNRSGLFSTIDVQSRMNLSALRESRSKYELALLEKTRFPCLPGTTYDSVSFYLFSCSSLIDVFVELCCMSFDDWMPSAAKDIFEDPWLSTLTSSLTDDAVSLIGRGNESEGIETEIYKLASAVPENRQINEFRYALDAQLACRQETKCVVTGRKQSFFPVDLAIEDLVGAQTTTLAQITRFSNQESSIILRSFAVLFALNSGRDFRGLSAAEIRDILGRTTGFSQTLSIDEVLQIRDRGEAIDSPIVSFLALIMLNERSPNDDREFELRMSFMTFLSQDYQGDILQFLDWINERTPGLSDAIVSLCDIAFLERLYLIYRSYEEVLEKRQEICRWAYENLNNNVYLELAEQLELDAKVRAIRDELDDTRIYVEETRFKQWVSEHVTPVLLRYQRQVEILGLTTSDTVVKKQASEAARRSIQEQMQSDFYLYHALDIAFSEFCHNRTFGIDSYLSRRIRHGSLVGQLQAPIKTLVDQFIEDNKSEISEDEIQELYNFYRDYTGIVHELKDEKLYFKGKDKPQGLFSSDALATKSRLETCEQFRAQLPSLFESGITASLLVDAIPEICWSLLEDDLHEAREEIKHAYRSQVRQVLKHVRSIDPGESKWAALESNMVTSAHERFSEVVRWFYRPERSSMTVSIVELAEVVKKEINAYYPESQITFEFQGNAGITLSGSAYHAIYDIYFVLFDNASKYAETSSPVKIRAEIRINKLGDTEIHILSSTRIRDTDNHVDVENAIEASLSGAPLQKAMISEGKSGLRKVQWLLETYPKPGEFSWQIRGNRCFFDIALPIIMVTKGVVGDDSKVAPR